MHRVFASITKWTWLSGAVVVSLLLLVVNLRLHSPMTPSVPADVLPQLEFIGDELLYGAGQRMQMLFPEGFFFTHELYGLAWIELGLRHEEGSELRQRALREARWARGQIDSAEGRRPFEPGLRPAYGIFYAGWSAWLRGGILMLQPDEQRDPAEVTAFVDLCDSIGSAFAASPTPFLAAYPGQAWPCDSTVAVAALRLHDRLLAPRFEATADRWVAQARERLDEITGLLPHRADISTGRPVEVARGTSQSIIQRFLPEIDPAFAREQYAIFRRSFIGRPLGLPGIREYPQGISGGGDVDSGPLIFGVSASATVVTIGAAQVHGDVELARPLLQVGEAFGLPVRWNHRKRYAAGLVPVGDAFLAWSKTAMPWTTPYPAGSHAPVVGRWWRLPTHALSLGLMMLLWLPMWVGRLRRRTHAARGSDNEGAVEHALQTRSGPTPGTRTVG